MSSACSRSSIGVEPSTSHVPSSLDDLEFVSVDDELAHHGAHHVVDRDDADDQGVLVENDGEVGAGALEDVEHFGKRQAVRNEGAGLDDAGLLEGDRLVVEDLSQDVARIRTLLQQDGRKNARRFSAPRLELPPIPWRSLILGLAAFPVLGGMLWVAWSSWEKLWSLLRPIFL